MWGGEGGGGGKERAREKENGREGGWVRREGGRENREIEEGRASLVSGHTFSATITLVTSQFQYICMTGSTKDIPSVLRNTQ